MKDCEDCKYISEKPFEYPCEYCYRGCKFEERKPKTASKSKNIFKFVFYSLIVDVIFSVIMTLFVGGFVLSNPSSDGIEGRVLWIIFVTCISMVTGFMILMYSFLFIKDFITGKCKK